MRATIIDIKNRTGLSLATISKYLNGGKVRPENQAKIEEAVQALHYQVNQNARSLVTSRTQTIGVITNSIESLFAGVLIRLIGNYFHTYSYDLVISDSNDDPETELRNLRSMIQRRVDGIILMPVCNDSRLVEEAAATGIPVVCVDRRIDGANCDSVVIDNINTGKALTDLLYRAGHRRIAYLGSDAQFTGSQRLEGYRRAIQEYGLTGLSREYLGEHSLATGYQGMKHFLSLDERPTGVFASNYEVTLGAVMAIREAGLSYPQDISLVGFDNLLLTEVVVPRITVAEQPMKELAESAGALLLRRLETEGEDEAPARQEIVLHATIRELDSVAPCREPELTPSL